MVLNMLLNHRMQALTAGNRKAQHIHSSACRHGTLLGSLLLVPLGGAAAAA
jgi:hypothetical protein